MSKEFAFPVSEDNFQKNWAEPGMTLRDYFASEVLPVCYAEAYQVFDKTGFPEDWRMGVALDAYMMADAMLGVRK